MSDAAVFSARDRLSPLRHFVSAFTDIVGRVTDERNLFSYGSKLLTELIASNDWLPETHALHSPDHYRQYLLYSDPLARFSVVSFVWAPGQKTPIHDHTVWGLVGVLQGAEVSERFTIEDGRLRSLGAERLERGAIDRVSPSVGDLHQVSNGLSDGVSISIHIYGADIGAVERSTYGAAGQPKPFISGYSPAPELAL